MKLKPSYAFGEKGSSELNIPPNASIEYEVTLNSFERVKESWSMDDKERIEQSKLLKEKGTNYFKIGKYNLALKLYKRMQAYLESNSGKIQLAKGSFDFPHFLKNWFLFVKIL